MERRRPQDPSSLSPLEWIAAVITLRCPDALKAGTRHERLETVHDLYLLVLDGLLQLGLWTTAFLTFGLPGRVAVPAGLLIALLIVELDVRMTASDTAPRGVLRQGPRPRSYWGLLAARIFISLVLAHVTATALDLTVFRPEALEAMSREREAVNAPLIAAYDHKLTMLKAEDVGPIEAEIADLTEQRASALADQSRAADQAEATQESGFAADLESERQDQGIQGRDKGHGPLAIDAEKQHDLDLAQAQLLTARKADLAGDVDRLSRALTAANDRLHTALPRFSEASRRLQTERDARLLKPTTGPLTVILGLLRLQADPRDGPAVWAVSIMAWSAVMCLELAFFLVRSVFRGASLHDARLNADIQRQAVTLAHDLDEHVRHERRRPPLRVVGDDDPPDRPDAAA